jgi:hypothetical protein
MNVRVVSAVATLVLFFPVSAFAQEVGIKAGVNFASLTPEEDEDPDTSRRVGLVAGGWFRPSAAARVSFQAEALFTEKGVKFDSVPFEVDSSGSVIFGSVTIRVRYIEVPLLARVDFSAPGSSARVFAVGGAAPAFKLSARARTELGAEQDTRDIGDDVESVDVGLVGGLGVEFGRAVIEARYTHGVLNINVDDNDPNDRIQNRVFSVTVGFRMR